MHSLLTINLLQQLKLVMDSIIWAFRHTERNIAETGLNLLLEMLKNFQVWYLTVLVTNFVVRLSETFEKNLIFQLIGKEV